CETALGPVRPSTYPERDLVVHLLRAGKARPRLRGSASALVGHCGDDGSLLAAVDDRRDSVRTLLGLGQFRQRVEFHDLAAEWIVKESDTQNQSWSLNFPRPCPLVINRHWRRAEDYELH